MTPRPTGLPIIRRRIALAVVFLAGCFALVGARLVDVMVIQGSASAQGIGPVAQGRADLVDRNGVLIARDLPIADLYAEPRYFWDTNEAASALAAVTGGDPSRLAAQFAPKRGYVLVARALSPDKQDAVMHLGLPGVTFQPGAKRYYPGGRVMAQVIGQVDSDDHGVSGLELGLDKRLRATNAPVVLSLDMRVQYALEHEIVGAMGEFKAIAAGGIVMDMKTGEILAMVSLPDYEPNSRTLTATDLPRNRMTQDVYELGSIFKIFAFSEAMDEHTVRLDETFDVGHPYRVANREIHDFEKLGPILSAAQVFAQSSNIGTSQIAARFGAGRQHAFIAKMGLLTPLKTELPEMASPIAPRQWGPVESATISFGHGISVNPLAFVAAAAAAADGGTLIHPTFLKTDVQQSGTRVISEEASERMRELLRLVVTSGTGTKADVPGYDVGGKTGTAEKAIKGHYSKDQQLASFCAMFPISNPRYLVFAMLDDPHATKETFGFKTAGWTIAPGIGRVIARIAPLLGVPKDDSVAVNTLPLSSSR